MLHFDPTLELILIVLGLLSSASVVAQLRESIALIVFLIRLVLWLNKFIPNARKKIVEYHLNELLRHLYRSKEPLG